MTTYYADDFIKSGYFQRFARILRLIALEILEYPKYRYSNSRSWNCLSMPVLSRSYSRGLRNVFGQNERATLASRPFIGVCAGLMVCGGGVRLPLLLPLGGVLRALLAGR